MSELVVSAIAKHFGGVYAVRDVSMTVADGELRGIIGPNGAGKSTLFNLVSGHLPADQGTIALDGRRIEGLPPHHRAGLGVSIVFQAARIFRGMTVRENVMVGAHGTTGGGFLAAALRLPAHHRAERRIAKAADDALAQVGLAEWADRPAEALPLGRQRSLQLARALCAEPKLLLLDEPASGLRAAERESVIELLQGLRETGLTMMLIEHDVSLVSRLADRITVVDLGQVIAEGTPEQIRDDPKVVAAYLGQEAVR
jgi:branched-chain amino acid transport system ATP-binding protein